MLLKVSIGLLAPLGLFGANAAVAATPNSPASRPVPRVEAQRPSSTEPGPGDQRPDSSTTLRMRDHLVLGNTRLDARVVILRMSDHFPDEGWRRAELRTAGELRALGLEVAFASGLAQHSEARLAELGAQAAAHRAVAAVRIVRNAAGPGVARIWLYDAATGKMVMRRVRLDSSRGGDHSRAALRVVELLHASLIEVRLARGLARKKKRLPDQVERLVDESLRTDSPARGRWYAWIGPTASFTPGGIGAVGGVALGVGWRPWPWCGLGAELSLPVLAAGFLDAHGHADVHSGWARALMLFEPWQAARVSPAFGLAIGGMVIRASGEGVGSTVGQSGWAGAALASMRTQLAISIVPAVRIVAAFAIGLALPEIAVLVDDWPVTAGGRPLIDVALNVEWSWGEGRHEARGGGEGEQ